MAAHKIKVPTLLALSLIGFWVLALLAGVGTTAGWIADARGVPIEGDYNGVYTAGQFALSGEPKAAYDWRRHTDSQRVLTGNPNSQFFPWPYPPSFLFVAAALALLPYYLSMLSWTLATFALFAAAIRRITTSDRDFLLMLSAPAAWLNLYIGQNGALTAGLIGFGLVTLPARPVVAGVCLGLLSIKPHLGLLIPLALAAGGYWRAFAAAAVTTLALALATTLAFGVDPWLAMPEQLQRVAAIVKTTLTPQKLQSVFGVARSFGASAETALALQAALILALAAGIVWLWRQRDIDFNLKAAALAAAITLASPYQFVYDLTILTISQAFLLRYLAKAGHNIVEIVALLLANVLIFRFAATTVPLGVFGCMIVMALIVRRIALQRAVATAGVAGSLPAAASAA